MSGPRRLSAWLIAGIIAMPLVFAWATLRKGYSRDVRIGAFLLAGISAALAVTQLL